MPEHLRRDGELFGLSQIIYDLLYGNLAAHPERTRLLDGKVKRITITAHDIDSHVRLFVGDGEIVVADGKHSRSHLWVYADSETLLDLPRARSMAGLPSVTDEIGRQVIAKLLRGKLKVRGILRVGLLAKLQKLLSVG